MAKKKLLRKLNLSVVALGLLILAIIILVVVTLTASNNNEGPWAGVTGYTDPKTGLTVEYKTDLKLISYDPPNNESVLFNLTKSDPKILVTSWYDEGDYPGGNNANVDVIEGLLNNTQDQLGNSYKEVKVLSKKALNINGNIGGEVIFTHVSAGLPTTQRLTIIIKDETTSVRIACQSLTDDYEMINKDYFDPLISSARFQ